jgi:hypothetical protein
LRRWSLFLILFSFQYSAFADSELIKSVEDSFEFVENLGTAPLSCDVLTSQFEGPSFCFPSLLQAASIHFNFTSQNYPTSDRPLISLLRQQEIPIRGRLFGSSIQPDYSQNELNIQVRSGDDLQFRFTPRPGFYSLDSVFNDSEGQCPIDIYESVDAKVALTMQKMRELTPNQQEAWVQFCEEYPQYEQRAREMRDVGWVEDSENGQEHYRGCAPGLNWKRVSSWGLCGDGGFPLYSPEIFEEFGEDLFPAAIFFHFDGYGDFNPGRARMMGAENLRGDERGSGVLGWQNANGLRFYESLLSMMFENDDDFNMSQIQFHYHDGADLNSYRGENTAAACFEDMQRWLDAIGPLVPNFSRPRTIAMGYSNGGAAALNFQHDLGRNQRELDLLITLDPIPRPGRFVLRNLLPSDLLADRHPNTRRHLNLFQDIDFGSMGGLRLRSQALDTADVNINVLPQDWDGVDGRRAHVYLLETPIVQLNAYCEFQAILNSQASLCQ